MSRHNPKSSRYALNPFFQELPEWYNQLYQAFTNPDIQTFHHALPGYQPTPLIRLTSLERRLKLGGIYVKDESQRFGVKAFKPLGASYAIFRFLKAQWETKFKSDFTVQSFSDPNKLKLLGTYTFCAATDGNHGRAVAWTAKQLKQKAVIYMPSNTAEARIKSIQAEDAETLLL